MRVLVSGGSGPIVRGMIAALLRRGHSVRLRSADGATESRRWTRVEPFDAIGGSAGGCDAVVHIGSPNLPEMIAEAERESGFRRFALVVAATDAVDESLLASSRLGWTLIRHSTLIGPADDVVTPILKMVRTLPIVPVVKGANEIRPLWYEDFARAVVALLERRDTARRTFAIEGSETLSLDELVERLRKITARKVAQVPVPAVLESHAASFPDDTLDSAIHLRDIGIEPTPLDRALGILADAQPEQFLDEGIGKMHHKRFWADIRGSRHAPESLMTFFREHVNDVMPIDFVAEPGSPSRIERGATFTIALPLRGHVQVRIERCDPIDVVFATVEAHPIAGMLHFAARQLPDGALRFSIDNYSRAGNFVDAIALRTAGEPVQSANWRKVVENMIDASGGTSDGVVTESRILDEGAAAVVERSLREMVESRQRAESAAAERPAQR